jgi:sec-independent protein translocase protein TatC
MTEKSAELIAHLTELRRRIIYVALWFILVLGIGFYISPKILLYIKSQPAAVNIVWNVFSFTDGLFIYMKCAFLFALVFALPVALYHIWAFVKPGLTVKEAKGSLTYVPLSFILFIIGIAFSYYIVFPMMVKFMNGVNQSIGAVETYGIDKYFSFMFNLIFPMGAAFEMPIIIFFLTKIGLLTPSKLKKTRKYAYLLLIVVASTISPPDFVSHLSVAIPLFVLFELGVIASSWYYNKTIVNQGGKQNV